MSWKLEENNCSMSTIQYVHNGSLKSEFEYLMTTPPVLINVSKCTSKNI
jgi:hypothetical protein